MTIKTSAVDYSRDGTTFEGYLAYDDASAQPRPVVLIAHAWAGAGDFEQARARQQQ